MAKNMIQIGAAPAPTQEQIARRAHEIWEGEGRPEGRALEHWYCAVSELKAQGNGQMHASEVREMSPPKPRASRRANAPASGKRFQSTS